MPAFSVRFSRFGTNPEMLMNLSETLCMLVRGWIRHLLLKYDSYGYLIHCLLSHMIGLC